MGASLDNDLGGQADHEVIAGARLASARTGLAFMWPGPARTPTSPRRIAEPPLATRNVRASRWRLARGTRADILSI
jgi:hypothetical protein